MDIIKMHICSISLRPIVRCSQTMAMKHKIMPVIWRSIATDVADNVYYSTVKHKNNKPCGSGR